MGTLRFNPVFSAVMLFIAAICVVQPVLAANETVTISYRGAGGSYIGDTVVFDGKNTAGNTTVLTITGPGLPARGVPVYNLSGVPGSGNTVTVNPDGSWQFPWFTANIHGVETMQTARYYVTAADLSHPEISDTTSVLMKKPEFYVRSKPDPAHPGDYVSLTGNAEQGITSVRIDVTDAAGTILRTSVSPVSASGYFSYNFHADMQPGQYTVVVSHPSMKETISRTLTVLPAGTEVPVGGSQTGSVDLPVKNGEPTMVPPVSPAGTSSLPLSPFAVITGLVLAGILFLSCTCRIRRP